MSRDLERKVPGAATQIEYNVLRPETEGLDHVTSPRAIDAEAQDAVHPIVAGRNALEHLSYRRCVRLSH